MVLTCLCGQVRITLPERPAFIHQCNCTLCSKTGARWAYTRPELATITGPTRHWTRADKPEANAEIHFCPTCGATTHFALTPLAIARHGNTLLGINMWLAEPAALCGLELRFPDGRAWPGHGDFTYVREAHMLA